MPSPFPGMNPYLEHEWLGPEVHHRLIVEIANQLIRKVGPAFIVNIGKDVYLRPAEADERTLLVRPDVSVAQPLVTSSGQNTTVATAVGIPGVLDLDMVERQLGVVEILDRDSRSVVTVIELLSPSNKYAGRDQEQFARKRVTYLMSSAHYIELDLLRGGPRMPCEGMPRCDYVLLLSRVESRPHVELFPFDLRDAIPILPVPLTGNHRDATLDLRVAIDTVYDQANYVDRIYQRQPHPSIRAVDRTWVAERLASNNTHGDTGPITPGPAETP